MSVVQLLEHQGGVASRHFLLQSVSRHALERAVEAGNVVLDTRGRYALPHADEALRAANRLTDALRTAGGR